MLLSADKINVAMKFMIIGENYNSIYSYLYALTCQHIYRIHNHFQAINSYVPETCIELLLWIEVIKILLHLNYFIWLDHLLIDNH